MNFARSLDGAACKSCGAEELVWWIKDETESTVEVYVDCRDCGREFPKRTVSKTDDTSDDALESLAREVAT